MTLRPRTLALPQLAAVALLLASVSPQATSASPAPATPTFVLAWGNSGSAPGQLGGPNGVAVDPAGNVFVVDEPNSRIEKFDALGNLLTQWGSPGSGNSQFSNPTGIAVDAAGNVYVADYSNNRVQKFTNAGSYVFQWGTAGSGNGQFQNPSAIAVAPSGNIYVADWGNGRIERFGSGGNYLSQFGSSGSGDGQFSGPDGLALDAAGNVYVTDYFDNRVEKFTSAGTYVAKWGATGSGNGQFQNPAAVAVDAVGNVYVTDVNNQRVQKFDGSGGYLAQWGAAGTGDAQFQGPWGVAVDAAGNVYVTDNGGARVEKFSGAGAALALPAPGYLLKWPSFPGGVGIAADGAGHVYVLRGGLGPGVFKFDLVGTHIANWPAPVPPQHGGHLAVDAAGDVYFSTGVEVIKDSSVGTLLTHWGSTGTGDGQFQMAAGVAVGPDGSVYVADLGNNRVQEFTSTGTFITKWGTPGSGDGQFNQPTGVAVGAEGNVYVADMGNNRVQKFSSTGTFITKWGATGSGSGQFNAPEGMAIGPDGNIHVVDGGNSRVQEFTSNGAFLAQWGTSGTLNGQFVNPTSVTVDAAGSVYVTDETHGVQKFASPPRITLISDVAGDQGGLAHIHFLRSSADSPGSGATVSSYSVFRRVDPVSIVGNARDAHGQEPTASTGMEWVGVVSVTATGAAEYDAIVPTLANARSGNVFYSAYFVTAAASPDPALGSGIENGYSIDNLAPPQPTPFTAAYDAVGSATHLHWGVSTASDFVTFRLYRDLSAGFTPGAGNLVASPTDTNYTDVGPAGRYYKLSAVDVNGNEGVFAALGPAQTLAVPGDRPLAFALEPVWPNPAAGHRLRVQFVLPSASPARLELLDVAGRSVAAREVGALGAGAHAMDLAEKAPIRPGLYFLRLRQGASEQVRRVSVLEP